MSYNEATWVTLMTIKHSKEPLQLHGDPVGIV